MKANFKIIDAKIVSFDKLIIVFNFHEINEVFNQGFSFKKKKIKDKKNIAGIWRLKFKKNKITNTKQLLTQAEIPLLIVVAVM